ncbi:BMP and activin membrane-bound inhibitor homolog isoform X2 [Agrilus planipennis]|uniref:BMP and activin membrane-bound inhibitor homolog isoform X2 n=1 Tax=Agrilus planipennis TaxID=224129 RepID=A0A1W4XIE4_AGRPL|nr:BMP and activin membrane-bound inhibitor homolog isoform X2 [Agrilus planipennis]
MERDYVRCFCNLPVCVSSGYMCKSGGGGCFSDVQDGTSETRQAPSYQGRHGCLELITDKEQRAWCEKGNNSKSSTKKRQHPRSLFHCCYHDMCNHVDSPETRLLLNSSLFEETMKSIEDRQVTEAQQEDLLYTNSDVWFRAATIALPICGLVIVIALVLLAVRLLQPEPEDIPNHKLGMPPYILTHHSDLSSRRHNRIIRSPIKSSHHHNPLFSNHTEDYTGQSYLPLIIQKDKGNLDANCDKKNETHARFNILNDNSSLVPYSFYDSKEITGESDKYQKSVEYDYKENLNTVTDNNSLTGNRNCFSDVLTISEKTYCKEPIS